MATQAERRESTRARLLEAAMDSLLEQGCSGFTTTEVVKRSGCSRGALFDHFPGKDDLLAATIEHLFDQLRSDYQERFAALRPAQRTIARALRLLIDLFDDERLLAAYELYGAARTDKGLYDALRPVVERHNDAIYELAASLPIEAPPRPAAPASDPAPSNGEDDRGADDRLRSIVALAVYSLQGVALQSLAQDVRDDRRTLIRTLEGLAGLEPARAADRSPH
jgi:AcrR family transcriptional regulator